MGHLHGSTESLRKIDCPSYCELDGPLGGHGEYELPTMVDSPHPKQFFMAWWIKLRIS